MSYIINIRETENRDFNLGTTYVGGEVFNFDDSIDDKINLLKVSRAFSKTLLGFTVPISYSKGGDTSYTDGKTIVISSEIKNDSLDSTIGLVLHESSHIAITDFDVWNSTKDKVKERGIDTQYTQLGYNLLNWIEDRRIDNWAYNKAPGYEKYYEALYYRYFLPEKTNTAIEEFHKKSEIPKTINNYMFFIINSINDKVRGDELPDLDTILDLIDLENVDRLYDTKECQDIALDVLEIILKNIDKEEGEGEEGEGEESEEGEDSDKGEGGSGKKKVKGNGSDGSGKPMSDEEFEDLVDGMSDEELDDLVKGILKNHENLAEHQPSEDDTINKIPEKLLEKIEKEILGLDIKSELDKNAKLGDKSNAVREGFMIKAPGISDPLEVVVYSKINSKYIINGDNSIFRSTIDMNANDGLLIGKKNGKLLGKKLKLRDEVRVTKLVRQKKGKIDPRTIYTGGYKTDEMFYDTIISKHSETNVHFSVDASGSMNGTTWKDTIALLSSLAYGFSEVGNVRLQISFRTQGWNEIQVFLFYDSKVDTTKKLDLLKYVSPTGGTPEGLCYKALNKKILLPLLNKNTIFVNLSDGAPSSYAIKPTQESIKLYESMGMEILSFLIEDKSYGSNSTWGTFVNMYGEKNSFHLSTNDINEIAKIVNKKLLNIKK